LNNYGYVRRTSYKRGKLQKTITLSRLILNAPIDKEIDHINGDKLDNRKINLRIVSDAQNKLNHLVSKNSTTGITGVNFHKTNKRWVTQLSFGKKKVVYKSFLNFEDAVNARKEAEKKYFGEFA